VSVDPSVELLDEGSEDSETAVISWLRPLLPDGAVANARLAGEALLPFIEVNKVAGEESDEQGWADDLVSVHCLYPRGLGNSGKALAAKFSSDVHRRMLLLCATLGPVTIDGREVGLEYCSVAMGPEWTPYGDERILRKTSRFRVGLPYAKMS